MAGLSLCASSAFVDCGAETLPRNEERSAASSYLPEAFSADPERLARFQREAEVLASLNHPNIAAIHGLEEADGIRALVLELVEGPTLADRIKQGPIPLDEALPIAKQIAEALEAAHEAGVIAVLSLESGDYDVLVPGGSNPRYVPTGHIVYGVGGTLRAVGFDLDSLTVTSDPVPIVDDVLMGSFGAASFAVAHDGSLVYVRGGAGAAATDVEVTLVWVDRDGREEFLAAEPDRYVEPSLSPDGTRLATRVVDDEGGWDIYIYDIARNNFTQLTFAAD